MSTPAIAVVGGTVNGGRSIGVEGRWDVTSVSAWSNFLYSVPRIRVPLGCARVANTSSRVNQRASIKQRLTRKQRREENKTDQPARCRYPNEWSETSLPSHSILPLDWPGRAGMGVTRVIPGHVKTYPRLAGMVHDVGDPYSALFVDFAFDRLFE